MAKKNKLEAELNYVVGHEAVLLARLEADVLQEEDLALLRHYEQRRRKLVDMQQYQQHKNGYKVKRPYTQASFSKIRQANDGGVIG